MSADGMAVGRNGGTPGPVGGAEAGEDRGTASVDTLRSYRLAAVPPYRLPPCDEPTIIAESTAMRFAVELARRFAPLLIPVLLVGPTGTGKEVLAQAIGRWSGRRKALVALDCGAVPTGLIQDALFGHRRGAFTTAVESASGLMEQADGGTILLDELASLPLDGQAALLRALETGEVRRAGDSTVRRVTVRVIAAVNGNVAGLVQSGRLRADLYHRLAAGIIRLPALADRMEDVWPLSRHFAGLHGRSLGLRSRLVVEGYDWPGNVRELRNVIERAALLESAPALSPTALAEAIELGRLPVASVRPPQPAVSDKAARQRAELEEACRRHEGRIPAIAAELGVSRATLYRRMARFGLRAEAYRHNRMTTSQVAAPGTAFRSSGCSTPCQRTRGCE